MPPGGQYIPCRQAITQMLRKRLDNHSFFTVRLFPIYFWTHNYLRKILSIKKLPKWGSLLAARKLTRDVRQKVAIFPSWRICDRISIKPYNQLISSLRCMIFFSNSDTVAILYIVLLHFRLRSSVKATVRLGFLSIVDLHCWKVHSRDLRRLKGDIDTNKQHVSSLSYFYGVGSGWY